ncbi:hypothetical protein M5M_08435 [Simiduia agarivorans SA1 = DSM 21679]|uniref:Probable membrane transporter protein n=1 Tax=Simiduia agarivorans (strain DSM 21679 / JCM 13881 / BCRC 17597 / SA1) TaxID=1117647 RepID=K4KIM4_SIMAS|nr:hypothetical protein M5M_08435 [Simiduia agarivorans SA1 = DSM 21679]
MLLLFLTAFTAGFVSSIAGAGGMIVLPVLLWVGIPPLNALAVNKFQSVFGTLTSTVHFFRQGHLALRPLLPGLVLAVIASVIGTWSVQQVGNAQLEVLLPWALIGLALYFMFSRHLADEDRPALLTQTQFNGAVAPVMGFYGGFFGPGMGSIFAAVFTRLRGFGLRAATTHTKPFVLVINTTSMLVFVFAGYQWWGVALLMALAQALGARLGAGMVLTRGAGFIRPVLILVTLALAVKLLWF